VNSREIIIELKKVLTESEYLSEVKAVVLGYRKRNLVSPQIQIDLTSREESNYSLNKERAELEVKILAVKMVKEEAGIADILALEDNIYKALFAQTPVLLNGAASDLSVGVVEYGFVEDNINMRAVTIPLTITYFINSKTRT